MAQSRVNAGEEAGSSVQARFSIPRCAQLRAGRGLNKKGLSDLAGVDRTTLSRIERGETVKIETAMSVFNALNDKHGGSLDSNKEVIEVGQSLGTLTSG